MKVNLSRKNKNKILQVLHQHTTFIIETGSLLPPCCCRKDAAEVPLWIVYNRQMDGELKSF